MKIPSMGVTITINQLLFIAGIEARGRKMHCRLPDDSQVEIFITYV